jgi:hypothetical protein
MTADRIYRTSDEVMNIRGGQRTLVLMSNLHSPHVCVVIYTFDSLFPGGGVGRSSGIMGNIGFSYLRARSL